MTNQNGSPHFADTNSARKRVGGVHRLIREQGKQGALQNSEVDRRVIEAAAAYLADEDGEIGFLYSGWASAALPHRRLPDDQHWEVRTDRATLVVQPGLRAMPGAETVHVGVPYGSRARLILIYLQSEALKTNSREVELGRSLHAWLRRLEIPIGGRSMRDVRDQAERISRCRMSFQVTHGGRTGLVNQNIVDTAMFLSDDTGQGSLFTETATLSQTFFDQLKKHPIPIEESAVRQIANNSMALDVYCWLAYRLHALDKDTIVTWKALKAQFGRGIARSDHFKSVFRNTLQLAMAVYPEADVEPGDEGLILRPSNPPVAPRSARLR